MIVVPSAKVVHILYGTLGALVRVLDALRAQESSECARSFVSNVLEVAGDRPPPFLDSIRQSGKEQLS